MFTLLLLLLSHTHPTVRSQHQVGTKFKAGDDNKQKTVNGSKNKEQNKLKNVKKN